jgi:PAS domain S-box-containing protein
MLLEKGSTSNFPLSSLSANDQHYYQLLQSLPAAIYTCDNYGYVKLYNQAAVTLWGREPKSGQELWCGSWRIYKLDGSLLPLDECPMAIALKEKRAVTGEEIVIERPDGERRHVLPHPQPLYNNDGEMIGAVNMLVDITDHKKTNEMNRQLLHFNEQLEQFAYAASHDMQEPLRKISTFASLLEDRNCDQLDDSGKTYLKKISNSVDRMSDIINDLLNYTRESKRRENIVAVDLNEIVKNVLSDLELIIHQKNATFLVDTLPSIRAMPNQITRLFYNLFSNSLKFSKETETPAIKVTVKQTSTFLEICIQDNGIGFDPKYAEKIFGLFQRLNDRKSYTGTGIGLSLCKKIVENHGGEILAHSKPDEGALFIIRLPESIIK